MGGFSKNQTVGPGLSRAGSAVGFGALATLAQQGTIGPGCASPLSKSTAQVWFFRAGPLLGLGRRS